MNIKAWAISKLRPVLRPVFVRYPLLYWLLRGRIYYQNYQETACEKLTHEALASRIADLKPARVLEYGVGNASFLKKLHILLPDAEFHAVDISATQIQTARKNFPQASYALSDLMKLNYPDGYFDVVVGLGVLIYLKPAVRNEVFRELFRVTGRNLIALEYVTRYFDAPLKARFDAAGDFRYDYDIEESLRAAGFRRVACSKNSPSWNPSTNPSGDLPHCLIVAEK